MRRKRSLLATLLMIAVFTLLSNPFGSCQERGSTKSSIDNSKGEKEKNGKKPIKLPGLVVDFKNHCVDVEATICLEKGLLELVACTKQSKEHESMVFVSARPMHVHTALLLLGVKNGNPAIRKQIGKENPRWVELPPRGDSVNVFFVFRNSNQKLIEHPVSDFIVFSEDTLKMKNRDDKNGPGGKQGAESRKFPRTFVFAGSQLQDTGKGPRQYLAEKSGNVISIATFGDELLCLPEVQSHKNDSLMWRIKPGQLPKVGTKILLRLRPAKIFKDKKKFRIENHKPNDKYNS